jgi:hypothetical protein
VGLGIASDGNGELLLSVHLKEDVEGARAAIGQILRGVPYRAIVTGALKMQAPELPIEQVRAELAEAGIDVGPAVERVKTALAERALLDFPLNKAEIHVVWAALQAMVNDIHAPQDCLSLEQWQVADHLLTRLDAEVNRREK